MKKICIALLVFFISLKLNAQSFKLLRYDEDYGYMKDSARNTYQSFKYLPLNKSGNVYASFGGEARAEYVDFNNEDWGRLNIGHNNFLLQRYSLHTDVHIGSKIRIFAQLRSALQDGRKNGPRGIDEDQLNIQNLFIDFTTWQKEQQKLTLRVGRQELDYGSGRLISVREGPNARLYFTGAKAMYTSARVTADAFIMMADTTYPGILDNKPTRQINLWGGYGKIIFPAAGNLDVYYIGIRRNDSPYEEGIAKEVRHTIGGRLWRYGGGFIYNLEAAYQFGSFGRGKISAWTASADFGYMFENTLLRPTINLRNDYISGDRNTGDGNLQTFNPIYPKGGYFGFSPQIGPVNLIDIHPYATFDLLKTLRLQLDVVYNWRYSLQDGVYRPSGVFNRPGASSNQRYIGTAYLGGLTYTMNRHIGFTGGIQYFKTGAFIQDIIPNAKDGLFTNARITIKF